MKLKLKKYTLPILILVGLALVSIGFWVFNTATRNRAFSESEVFRLIEQCKVDGIYSYHNGEVGVIMKPASGQDTSSESSSEENFKRVESTKQTLLQHQNPSCPYKQMATE